MLLGPESCELKMVPILTFLPLNSKNDAKNTVPLKTVLRPYKLLRLMYVS